MQGMCAIRALLCARRPLADKPMMPDPMLGQVVEQEFCTAIGVQAGREQQEAVNPSESGTASWCHVPCA